MRISGGRMRFSLAGEVRDGLIAGYAAGGSRPRRAPPATDRAGFSVPNADAESEATCSGTFPPRHLGCLRCVHMFFHAVAGSKRRGSKCGRRRFHHRRSSLHRSPQSEPTASGVAASHHARAGAHLPSHHAFARLCTTASALARVPRARRQTPSLPRVAALLPLLDRHETPPSATHSSSRHASHATHRRRRRCSPLLTALLHAQPRLTPPSPTHPNCAVALVHISRCSSPS